MAHPSFDRSTAEFGRGISFFDAVYGFAITLLIANIDLPPAAAWSSLPELWKSGLPGQLFGFLLSFAVIAVFWRLNLRVMSSVQLMSPALITWNIVAVLFVILIPFTTQGTSDPGTSGFPLPTVFYALNIALASLTQTAIYRHARNHGLTAAGPGRVGVGELLLHLSVPAVFLASIPVTILAGPVPGRLVWIALVVVSPVAGRLAPTLPPADTADTAGTAGQ